MKVVGRNWQGDGKALVVRGRRLPIGFGCPFGGTSALLAAVDSLTIITKPCAEI